MNKRRITAFLALAFGISWSIAGLGHLWGIDAQSGIPYAVLGALFMFGPAAAALILNGLVDRAGLAGLGLSFKDLRWAGFAGTALLGLCIVPLSLLLLYLLGDVLGLEAFGHVSLTSERMNTVVMELLADGGVAATSSGQLGIIGRLPAGVVLVLALFIALLAALSFNAPFMLGEELGWRGYLWQRSAHWVGIKRVGFTGLVWGLWHAPLIAMGHNYPGYPVAGIGMMVLLCLLLAILFDWSRMRVGSVWGPVVLHGIINGSAGVMALFAWGGQVLVGTVVGLGGCIALALLAAAVLVLDARYRTAFFGSSALVEKPST